METIAQFANATDAVRFILGGKATFTARSLRTGVRYTFKVDAAKDGGDTFFVSLLTGENNESDYSYIGILSTRGTGRMHFKTTAKSRLTPDSAPVKGIGYITAALADHDLPANVELWHEGRCARCRRKLTVPESIASGFGPECAGKAA